MIRNGIILKMIIGVGFLFFGTISGAWAANCGDSAGPRGSRIPCACGDRVVTNTKLVKSDPVVDAACPENGLTIGSNNIILDCRGTDPKR